MDSQKKNKIAPSLPDKRPNVTWQRYALRNKRLRDDVLLRIALYKRPEVAKAILEPILEKKDIEILELNVQEHSDLASGHSVVFDAVIKTADGTAIDVEVQNWTRKAPVKRMRYYSSLFDASSLEKGDDYRNLPCCVVIFIAQGDYGKTKEPLYHVRRYYSENMRPFDDGQEIIIANLENEDTASELGRLMHDMNAIEPQEMINPVLSDIVDRVKYDRGDETMDEALHRFIQEAMPEELKEARREGKKEGIKEGEAKAIVSLFQDGIIDEATAAERLGLSAEEFHKLVLEYPKA